MTTTLLAQAEALVAALRGLVIAKAEKDANGDSPDYRQMKAGTWEAARDALSHADAFLRGVGEVEEARERESGARRDMAEIKRILRCMAGWTDFGIETMPFQIASQCRSEAKEILQMLGEPLSELEDDRRRGSDE